MTFELEKNKWAKRLLVVSRFRLLVLKNGFFGKLGVEKNVPILDMELVLEKGGGVLSIESDATWLLPVPSPGTSAPNSVVGISTNQNTGTRSEIGLKTGDNGAFLTSLRLSYRWFSHGIPESNRLKFNVYKDYLIDLPELKEGEKEGASGIVNAYSASCNYLGRRMRESVRRYLLDLSERGIMDICLDDIPSEGGNSSSRHGIGYLDLEPIFLALSLNDCFESITSEFVTLDYSSGMIIGGGSGGNSNSSSTSGAAVDSDPSQNSNHHHHHNHSIAASSLSSTITQSSNNNPSVSGNAAMESLGRCLSRNRRLKRIELVGIGVSEVSALGMGLRMSSAFHQVSILNLSKNKLSERSGLALASCFEACTNHSMQSLNLNECELSGRVMGAIFDAFTFNPFFSFALQALYLGGNSLNEAATSALLRWSRKVAANGNPGIHLQFLSFAFCYSLSSLDALLGAISSLTTRLRWLDLSGLRMGDQERPAIESFIPSLQQSRRPQPCPTDFASIEHSDFYAPSPRNLLGLPSYASLDEDGDLPKIESSPPLLSDYALTIVLRKCSLSNDMVSESLFPALKRASSQSSQSSSSSQSQGSSQTGNGSGSSSSLSSSNVSSLNRISLDISLNDLTNTCITMFTQLTSDWVPLVSLRLSDVKMRPRTFSNFLNSPPPSLLRLDVSGCLSNASPSTVDLSEMNQAFTTYLTSVNAKSLLHLNLSNNRPLLSGIVLSISPLAGNPTVFTPTTGTGSAAINPSTNTTLLASIIYVLAQNNACALNRLEIEDNGAGDALGHALGRLLRTNTSLHSLRLDGNLIGLSGWQAIYAGMTQPPSGNTSLFDCPMPVKDVAKTLKSLPAPRQPLFLATIAHVQSLLAANTPKDVLKSTLQASLNATPLEAWPSLSHISPLGAADGGGGVGLASGSVTPSPSNPASFSSLVNPRVTISLATTAGLSSTASSRRLGMGFSSRASVLLSPSQLQELGIANTTPLQTSNDSDEFRRPRRKSVGPTLAISATDFFAAGGGRPLPSNLSAEPIVASTIIATPAIVASIPPALPPTGPPSIAPPLPSLHPPPGSLTTASSSSLSPRRSVPLPQPPSFAPPSTTPSPPPISPRPLPTLPPGPPPANNPGL